MTHDGKKRTQDPRRAALLFLISTIGLVVVVFSAALVKGRWQQRVRGIGPALPGPTDHAAVSPLCVNAALRTDPHLDITLNRIADADSIGKRGSKRCH